MAASEAWARRAAAALLAANVSRDEAMRFIDVLLYMPDGTKSVTETLDRLRVELDRQAL